MWYPANGFFVNSWVIYLIVLWAIPWKGVALWKAARLKDKWWFIALLVLNTIGILEILYIYVFSKRGEAASEAKSGKK